MKLVTTTWLSPPLRKNCMGIPWDTPEIQWFCLKQLKTAYFKHFEHFAAIEKFKTTNFAANHCEYVWNWSQQHDFHRRWEKNWMRIPWGTPEIQWFCLKQLKTAYFKHFEHFPAIEIFEKKICCKPLWICVKLVTTTWLSPLLRKNLHGNTLRHTWDTVILLKSAYFKHFEHFAAIEKFKTTNFAANHCENMWNWSQQNDFHHCWEKNCMGIPWGTPEIQWFWLKQLKTAYFKHFEHFPAIEIFEKIKFAANHCEYVFNWSQQHGFHRCSAKNCMGIPLGIPEIQ